MSVPLFLTDTCTDVSFKYNSLQNDLDVSCLMKIGFVADLSQNWEPPASGASLESVIILSYSCVRGASKKSVHSPEEVLNVHALLSHRRTLVCMLYGL